MNILITGAGSGIGFYTVLHLLKDESNHVIAISRSTEKLKQLEQEAAIHNVGTRLHTLPFDIISGDYSNHLHSFISLKVSQVNILINNAGKLYNKPFLHTAIDEFEQMLESNFIGHVKMIQAVVPFMKNGGHIVNIGSMGGFQGSVKFAGLSAYAASKAALHNLTESLSVEFADRSIKVNCLALGAVQTSMLNQSFPDINNALDATAMGSYIANFALTGDKFYNGKILPVAVSTP